MAAHIWNTFNINGGVDSVKHLHGATIVSTAESDGTAFTSGSYIIGGPELKAKNSNGLFQHEYGHYLQSQVYGPLYMMKVAIPSMGSKNQVGSPHYSNPVEQDANIRAFNYFKTHYAKYFDSYDDSGAYNGQWKWDIAKTSNANPINGMDWTNYKSQRVNNDKILSNSPTGLLGFEIPLLFFLGPIGEIAGGLINMGIYNATY